MRSYFCCGMREISADSCSVNWDLRGRGREKTVKAAVRESRKTGHASIGSSLLQQLLAVQESQNHSSKAGLNFVDNWTYHVRAWQEYPWECGVDKNWNCLHQEKA